MMHMIWVLIGCLCPLSTLVIMNILWPTKSVFLSRIFCSDHDDCPLYIVVPSIVEQTIFMLYYYFVIMIFDILPTACAVYIRRSMKES